MAGACLLAEATLAQHLNIFATRRVRTVTLQMTRCIAMMRAHDARLGAVLFANIAVDLAWTGMAGLDAFVLATGQWLTARQSTTEILLTAGNNFALLVAAVTEFRGERHARWTRWCRMTIVRHRMVTVVCAWTGFFAGRLLCATRYWWIDDASATLAI